MILALAFSDREAANRKGGRINAALAHMKAVTAAYEDALRAAEWQPPPLIAEAVKTVMYAHGLSQEGAVVLLDFLKRHTEL